MIIESLPSDLKVFLGEIENLGFTLTLVGGAPRDFIFANILGHDLDFEIRANKQIEAGDWPSYYKKFRDFLSAKKISYTELPYLITRFDWAGFKLEFSSPRTERNKDQDFTHHHFDAIMDSNLTHELSFKRRDFTINAIGIELDLVKDTDRLIDPYNGVHDLKNGILKNITADFFHDSVRFLRLIRFQLKFDRFMIDAELYKNLSQFNMSRLSHHHFKEELFKSSPGKFINLFSKLILEKNLQIPDDFKIWTKYTFSEHLFSKEEILAFVFLQSEKDAEAISEFFKMPAKQLRDLKSFFKSYDFLKSLKKENFIALLSLPLVSALEDNILKELKNLDEKKEWWTHVHLPANELLIDWNDWVGLKIGADELNRVQANLRSYYIYFKAIEKKFHP